jgi:hypothetical protein
VVVVVVLEGVGGWCGGARGLAVVVVVLEGVGGCCGGAGGC